MVLLFIFLFIIVFFIGVIGLVGVLNAIVISMNKELGKFEKFNYYEGF